jgi:hypothetical protein
VQKDSKLEMNARIPGQVWRIRLRLYDYYTESYTDEQIHIEIKGDRFKGMVTQGELIYAEENLRRDGILKTRKCYNYKTNSYFGITYF